jgi:uncharacterized protein (TIGR02246 family)
MTTTTMMRKAIGLAAILSAGAASAAPLPAAERAVLEAVAAANDAAWNAGDAATIAGGYAEDATLRLSGMTSALAGRPAIRAFFEKSFAARRETMRHITQVQTIEQIGPDLAFADSHVRVERRSGDGWELAASYLNHSLLRRENGQWRMIALRANKLP